MDRVWTYFDCQCTWPSQQAQPARTASPAEREASPAQPPSRASQPREPHQNCARGPQQQPDIAAGTAISAGLQTILTLWSGGLTAAFASRVLPPPPPSPQSGHSDTDLQYRNPAGQLVTRPNISNEEESTPMSDIEWAVQNIVRRKYPEIHYEIVIAALEHAGHIQPGADPAFPDSVLATVPPEGEPLRPHASQEHRP